jgi:hypothetical protein
MKSIKIPGTKTTYDEGDSPCIVCGKDVTTPNPQFLHIVYGDTIIDPAVVWPDQDSDLGWHPVGSGCLRRHPQLKQYARRLAAGGG